MSKPFFFHDFLKCPIFIELTSKNRGVYLISTDFSFEIWAFEVWNFFNCPKQNSIKILFGMNNWFAHFQGHVNYRFSVINNRHYALEYFFHYNEGLSSNKWAYIKSKSSNTSSLKVYIFGMCKLRGIFWYIIYANWMLLKIWPHLTFGWPFVDISLTIHPTHSKLYFCDPITSRKIWYTWKVIWSILKFWLTIYLCVTPTGKGPYRPKFCQNIFWPITTSKPSITHFHQNGTWVLFHFSLSDHFKSCVSDVCFDS